jgi:hypothetical protein
LPILKTISALTYKVVALAEVPDYNMDECVDWALEMIVLEYNTPSLLIVASLSKPTNYFEAKDYLSKALLELNIKEKHGKEAVLSYASFFIRRLAEPANIRTNLKSVYAFCQSQNYESNIYDFYLLYWAWDDFDYDQEYSSYWEGATKDTIEAIVIDTAAKWMAENKALYQLYEATTGKPLTGIS